MFNAKTAGLAIAGLLFTSAAQAFPGSADDAGIRLEGRSTYAAMHSAMPEQAASAFPGSAEDAGIRLQAHMTRADELRGRATESLRAGVQDARPAGTWTD